MLVCLPFVGCSLAWAEVRVVAAWLRYRINNLPWVVNTVSRYVQDIKNVPILLSDVVAPASAKLTACGSAKSSSPCASRDEVIAILQYSRITRHSLHDFCQRHYDQHCRYLWWVSCPTRTSDNPGWLRRACIELTSANKYWSACWGELAPSTFLTRA